MAKRHLTHEDVIWTYRLLLEREPENHDVIINAINNFEFLSDYIESVLSSAEFKLRAGSIKIV